MSSPSTAPLPPEDGHDATIDTPTEASNAPASDSSEQIFAKIAAEVVQEYGDGDDTNPAAGFHRYGEIVRNQNEDDDASTIRPESPTGSVSTHGDSPSVQVRLPWDPTTTAF